ncbi:hypothetical protein A8B82_01970 [Sulfitobacter sp. EhC04]|uniref:cupin domain-containing protein n=1 Tax=Sulfitobacter sp. EhC04 TaxID=1849168 RepID=UPI0007F4A221|nr:cupin domain-containing protein [Sulfitobacter sp. EhC04]OAN75720.1 hypothetical protein A8B82_01970 [Sulfitobacter sp. EhC04]
MLNLPTDYSEQLDDLNLRALWGPQLKSLMPGIRPQPGTQGAHWKYRDVRPQLLRATELTTAENAERRVLALVNPGFGAMPVSAATPTIFLGLQIILPGEWAPKHRHSPTAARIIVEGEGAYTTVENSKVRMVEGDVVLTPTYHWHEHGHEGKEPMVWLDVLDIPITVAVGEAAFEPGGGVVTGTNQNDKSATVYTCPGIIPYRSPSEKRPEYPMFRYEWKRVRAALDTVAAYAGRDEPIHMMYVNPETGENLLKPFDFSARLLRPGETVEPKITSATSALLVQGGKGESEIDGKVFSWEQRDSLAVPCFSRVRHTNTSSSAPAYLLQVDDAPLMHKLGYYQEV